MYAETCCLLIKLAFSTSKRTHPGKLSFTSYFIDIFLLLEYDTCFNFFLIFLFVE